MDSNAQIVAHRQLTLSSMRKFTEKMFFATNNTPYVWGEHHLSICAALDSVVQGRCRKLIINVPPRYGKTLLVSQMFIAYGLALNPRANFLHLSYSNTLVQENSLAVKDIIESEYYQTLFPSTQIAQGRNQKAKWSTTEGGGEYAISTLGQITGFGAGRTDTDVVDSFFAEYNPDGFAGAVVIDDPIKPEDALSDNLREAVNRRFETTVRNRVNSRRTPIIVIMQRLHEKDLCGYLMDSEPNEWTTLVIPAIKEDSEGNERALWNFKHTLEELHHLREVTPFVFETQYMQNPKPLEGLMYERPFKTYEDLPMVGKRGRHKCYVDTADTGADWLCAICYVEYEFGMYVTDVLYTKKPMEFTEPETAKMLLANDTEQAIIESNNGGRGFARNVELAVRSQGNTKMVFTSFTQTANKQTRIFTHSADVQNMVYFPTDWETRWREFARDIKSYRKEGKNAHDDACDALTSLVEHMQPSQQEEKKVLDSLLSDLL